VRIILNKSTVPTNVRCDERERLTQSYLDATESIHRASNSVEDIHSHEWREATKEARKTCETALAVLKTDIQEHGCLILGPGDRFSATT